MILDVLSWIFLATGSVVLVLAGFVILRMPTYFTRVHAASVNETLGPALILVGLALQAPHFGHGWGIIELVLKLGLILAFLLITSPVASHALAKAALENGLLPGQYRRRRESIEDADESREGDAR